MATLHISIFIFQSCTIKWQAGNDTGNVHLHPNKQLSGQAIACQKKYCT